MAIDGENFISQLQMINTVDGPSSARFDSSIGSLTNTAFDNEAMYDVPSVARDLETIKPDIDPISSKSVLFIPLKTHIHALIAKKEVLELDTGVHGPVIENRLRSVLSSDYDCCEILSDANIPSVDHYLQLAEVSGVILRGVASATNIKWVASATDSNKAAVKEAAEQEAAQARGPLDLDNPMETPAPPDPEPILPPPAEVPAPMADVIPTPPTSVDPTPLPARPLPGVNPRCPRTSPSTGFFDDEMRAAIAARMSGRRWRLPGDESGSLTVAVAVLAAIVLTHLPWTAVALLVVFAFVWMGMDDGQGQR